MKLSLFLVGVLAATVSAQLICTPQVYCSHAVLYCTPHNLGSKYPFSTGILSHAVLYCTPHKLGSKYPFSTGILFTCCTVLYTSQSRFKVCVLHRYTVHMLYCTVHLIISVQSIRSPQVYC